MNNKGKYHLKPEISYPGFKMLLYLLSLSILSICAMAQEDTAEDWYNKGSELERNGSYEEAKRVEMIPEASHSKGDRA